MFSLRFGIRDSELERRAWCGEPFRAVGHRTPLTLLALAVALIPPAILNAQVETVAGPPSPVQWVSYGHVEGHLALKDSSAGAFSPDSSLLAVASDEKVLLMNLQSESGPKVVKPRAPEIADLEIHSANFLAPHLLFLLANGLFHVKGQKPHPTPLLAIQWNVENDQLVGKVSQIGATGGFGPAHYFPMIGYLALYKEGIFSLWNPRTSQAATISIPDLTQTPNIYVFSPDGQWLLLAQIQTTSGADPSVVNARTHKFVDALRGHQGTVLSMAFSHDAGKVVTTCEDGKLRVYSTTDWKLLETLTGHSGAVHRAEFSPNGKWIASAGEDRTVRVWSADDGTLLQTLQESRAPLLGVTFSPDSRFIAASSENEVLIWKQM